MGRSARYASGAWGGKARIARQGREPPGRGHPARNHRPARITGWQIRAIVERFTSRAAVIRGADPADKAGICRGLNLVLAYDQRRKPFTPKRT